MFSGPLGIERVEGEVRSKCVIYVSFILYLQASQSMDPSQSQDPSMEDDGL